MWPNTTPLLPKIKAGRSHILTGTLIFLWFEESVAKQIILAALLSDTKTAENYAEQIIRCKFAGNAIEPLLRNP